MGCCDRSGYDTQFDAATAKDDLARYRRKGPDRSTRLLLRELARAGVGQASLLDIGGGVGVIHHELLAAGASSATHVDAASAYIETARQEAARRGHAERVRFIVGDFVAVAPELPPADVVTLDRVICCYADASALVTASAAKARRLYGAVYPRDTRLHRLVVRLYNLRLRWKKCSFRTFLHPPPLIEATLRRAGLAPASVTETILWRIVVFERQGGP